MTKLDSKPKTAKSTIGPSPDVALCRLDTMPIDISASTRVEAPTTRIIVTVLFSLQTISRVFRASTLKRAIINGNVAMAFTTRSQRLYRAASSCPGKTTGTPNKRMILFNIQVN
eukprot:m.190829 g.190829  ORF g.190829 m.190829 type:complete len:114 (-) comp15643_c0_seq14:1576-1917(-)